MTIADVPVPAIPLGAARILVVEHEADVALQLCHELGSLGFKICACVANGADAIKAAFAARPDVVLINAVLPGEVDGIRAAEDISRALQVPILFLSAYSDPDTVTKALDAHPYAYLTKPFDIAELYAQLLVCLAKGQQDSQAREALMWYEATLRSVADGVIVVDEAARLRFLNPAAERLTGCVQQDVLGHHIDSVLRLQDLDGQPIATPLREPLSGAAASPLPRSLHVVARNGALRTVEQTASPIHSTQGALLGALMVLRDTQDRTEAEQKLRSSEERFRNAFDLAPNGMAMATAQGRFIKVNNALCRLLHTPREQLLGRQLDDFGTGDMHAAPVLGTLAQAGDAGVQFEQTLESAGGQVVALVSASLIRLPRDAAGAAEPDLVLLQLHDLTERKKAERQLTHLAHHDSLTDLPNRAAITEEIERLIAMARRRGKRLAVVFLDLDYFKNVNDSLGHETGDELLRVIAARLRGSVRESDMVGRLGGDEFVVLLPEVEQLTDIASVAAKMQAECLRAIYLHGHELRVGTSVGISLYPDDATEPRSLLRYADSAMYKAKAAGRNAIEFYQRDMTSGMEQRLRLAAGLRHAVEQQQFELYFQPIVAIDSSAPHAAEALLRWNHPVLGLLGPDEFLPLAEDIGLGAQLGAWVLETACHEATAWPGDGAHAVQLAVNVAPSQFRKGDLVELVKGALAHSGLSPERLCLEITEHVMLEDNAWNRDLLRSLKALGVRISIDDFGTGYSSLSYLIKFSPSEMKIDRSLIEHLCDTTEHEAVVRAVVAMAHSLQLLVVAEGVETREQDLALRGIGCDLAQGFWYQRPSPAAQFPHILRQSMHS